MIYDTLEEEAVDDLSLGEEGAMDFTPLLEIGEAERFSAVVARLEEAGIPWFVENVGQAAVLYVTLRCLDEARELAG